MTIEVSCAWTPQPEAGDWASQNFMDFTVDAHYKFNVGTTVQSEKITPKFLIIDNTQNTDFLTLTMGVLTFTIPAATRCSVAYPEGMSRFEILSNGVTGNASVIVAEKKYIDDVSNQTAASSGGSSGGGVETGIVLDWSGGDTPPTGYLLCDGSPHSRATYTALDALYSALGYPYGAGDGVNTFNVPDYRGRVSAGKDNMGGSSANRITDAYADTLGGAGGSETHTLVTAEIPAHTHTFQTYSTDTGSATTAFKRDLVANSDDSPTATSSTGGGGAHANVQPTIAMNKIVKT